MYDPTMAERNPPTSSSACLGHVSRCLHMDFPLLGSPGSVAALSIPPQNRFTHLQSKHQFSYGSSIKFIAEQEQGTNCCHRQWVPIPRRMQHAVETLGVASQSSRPTQQDPSES